MSVARFSGPQILDTAVRTPQTPIYVIKGVGIGRQLGRYPDGESDQRLRWRLPEAEETSEHLWVERRKALVLPATIL